MREGCRSSLQLCGFSVGPTIPRRAGLHCAPWMARTQAFRFCPSTTNDGIQYFIAAASAANQQQNFAFWLKRQIHPVPPPRPAAGRAHLFQRATARYSFAIQGVCDINLLFLWCQTSNNRLIPAATGSRVPFRNWGPVIHGHPIFGRFASAKSPRRRGRPVAA